MAKSDVQSAILKWQNRASQARGVGLPDFVWKPLMQRDFASIMQGHSPMADAEVNDAMRSAVGLSPIKDPSVGHGPLDVIGNIKGDVENIVTGFIPGVVNYITSLPQQMQDLPKVLENDPATLKKYGLGEGITDLPSALRELANAPVVGPLIPGIHTAASLTTSQGRQSLEEHPVSAVIDVGSAAAMGGSAGLFGSGAEEAGIASREAALQEGKPIPAPTVMEALQKGEPYRAAGRAMLRGAEAIPGTNITRTSIRNVLMDLNIHPELVSKLSRPFNVIKTRLNMQQDQFMRGEIVKPILDLKVQDRKLGTDRYGLFNRVMTGETALTDEELNLLREPGNLIDANGLLTDAAKAMESDPATDPALADAISKLMDNEAWQNDVNLQTIGARARRWMDDQAAKNPDLVRVRPDYNQPYLPDYVYHKNHPVARKWTKYTEAAKQFDKDRKAVTDAKAAAEATNTPEAFQAWVDSAEIAKKSASKMVKARDEFQTQFGKHAPASMYNVLSEEMRGRAISYAQAAPERVAKLQAQLDEAQKAGDDAKVAKLEKKIEEQGPQMPLDLAIARIQGAVDWTMIRQAIGEKAANQMMKDVETTWRTLAAHGVDPIYLPNVKASRLEHVHYPTVIPEAPRAKAHMGKNTAFNLSRSVNDVAVGLIEANRQILTEAGTAEFANTWVRQWAAVEGEHIGRIQDAIRNGGPMTADLRAISTAEMDRHFRPWDPKKNGFGTYFPDIEGGRYVMPRGVERALKYLGFDEQHTNPFFMAHDRVMKVWRFSILTTPRHMSHVLLGGMMMGILRDPLFIPHFIKNFSEARGILQGDDVILKSKFGGGPNDFDPEQLVAIGASKSMGRIMNAVSKGFRGVNKFEENATLMYKITTMLTQEAKGATREEGIALANKMFVDMNSMLPIERVVLRKVFPFYGFTRHVFRYLMTYPADHPYLASILTNFANQHIADWQSGLPRDISWLFYLGAPDGNGNVSAIDYRSIDPFRSFYDSFYLGGLVSQMNPVVQMAAEQMGVNVLSGTPELYPNTHYDPNTGQIVADQPSNLLLRIMESILPETTAIDAKFQLTDRFRNLKVSDPAGFQHAVYTALGLPFGYETLNVPAKEQNAQMKRYRDAQTSIDQAVQSGDFSKAKRYSYVPVPSLLSPYIPTTYATPQQIEAVYRAVQQLTGTDVSLHAVLPKPTRRRTTP